MDNQGNVYLIPSPSIYFSIDFTTISQICYDNDFELVQDDFEIALPSGQNLDFSVV